MTNTKKTMKTNVQKETVTIDAAGQSLGRVATSIATALMGKNKPTFERNIFSGANVLVKNASKISITPEKLKSITHSRYSGYPGGLRTLTASKTIEQKGHKELLRLAVDRMLPKNKLHKEMLKHLKVEN